MKQNLKRLLASGALLLCLPAVMIAQDTKDAKKDKKKMQTIVITRSADSDEKVLIEVDGDKVKINGKDAKDAKDIDVNVNTITASGDHMRIFNAHGGGPGHTISFGPDSVLFHTMEDRAMLGVTTQDNDKGAQIRTVSEESSAAKAGLKKGDIITRIGDKKIEDADDVTKAIKDRKPGESVKVTYLRDGKEQTANATLSAWRGVRWNNVTMPRIPKVMIEGTDIHNSIEFDSQFAPSIAYGFGRPKLGISVQETEEGNGLRVLEVEEESNAAKAGIKKDDIILKIDDAEVKTTADVVRLTRQKKDKMNFQVRRDGKVQNLELKFPKKLRTADL